MLHTLNLLLMDEPWSCLIVFNGVIALIGLIIIKLFFERE